MADIKIGISTEGAAKAKTELNSVKDAGEKVVATNQKVEASNAKVNASYRGMGGNIRNASYQLQDFLVQVQGGTSITTSLSQQLPQLLSGFGLIGVVAGVAAAGLGIIITNLDLFSTKLERSSKAQKTANDELKKTVAVFELFQETTELITNKSANYIENWVIAYKKASKEVKAELKEQLQLELDRAEIAAETARQELANLLVKRGLLGQDGAGASDYSGQPRDLETRGAEIKLRQTENWLKRIQDLRSGKFDEARKGGDKQESLNITLQQRIDALQSEARFIGVSNAEREYGVMLAELQAQADRSGLDVDDKRVKKIKELIYARDAARSTEKLNEYVIQQQKAIELAALEGATLGMTERQHKKLVESRQLEANIAKETMGMQPEQKRVYADTARSLLLIKQQLDDVSYAQSRSFGAGAIGSVKAYMDELGNSAKDAKIVFDNAFKGIEDSMVSAFQTGKLSFKSMIDQMMADITRMIVRQALLKPIYGAIGLGGSGGGLGSLLSAGASLFGSSAQAGLGNLYQASSGIMVDDAGMSLMVGTPMATGTNYVPYDGFQATLHKGEAVVPAEYNPAAGGKSGETSITYSPIINIDSRTDQTQVRQLVLSAVQQGQVDLVDRINRGQVRVKAS